MLDRIVEQTRQDLARRRSVTPLPTLIQETTPSNRSLSAALSQAHPGFILECKRSSPSGGEIRPALDLTEVAHAYAPVADAVSVLTNAPFFNGSHDDLRTVRALVDCPLLCKDFVVDPYQVFEARVAGADAVLLMLSVLDDASFAECRAAADEAGIETLTEVHSEDELERALTLEAPVIGINNRDLRTLAVDRDVTKRLAPRVPADRIVVCESGIRNHEDVRELRPLVDAFLVGTALMKERDLAGAVRRLVYGTTKVCGLTRAEDALAAWKAGATHGGLIFANESPRTVVVEQAARLRDTVPLRWVGVFVNETPARIGELVRRLGLDAVQLHGEETPEVVRAIKALVPTSCEVWKAVRVRDGIPSAGEFGEDRLLLDAWSAKTRGGTGNTFDWSLLRGRQDLDRVILSGGLTPDNAGAAEATGAGALDVNSGVEDEPGIKNAGLIAAFFKARRGAGRRRKDLS